MSKKILVTGGAGYIGSLLVPDLLGRGYAVRVFDNMLFGDHGLDAVRDRIEILRGDILDPPAGLMDGIDAIIHLAGISSQAKASYQSPRYTDLMNHVATEGIGCLAKRSGVERFVFASSCSIYCAFKHTAEADDAPTYVEGDPVEVQNPYGLAKRAAEEALLEIADASFTPVILRQGTLYGFSPKMRYDLVLNSFTKDAFAKRKITVNAGGACWRPMVDIHDIIETYVASIEMPSEQLGDRIFNVLSENQRIKDLALTFQSVIRGAKNIDIEVDLRPFQATLNYRADNSRYRRVFGLTPQRSIRDAILETWDALERGHDFANPRFYNDPWYGHLFEQGTIRTGRRTPCTE